MSMKALQLITFLLLFAIVSCQKDVEIPNEEPIAFEVPEGWPSPTYNFENNALSQNGFSLGRKLFYDKKLSRDGNISCASCHQQFAAFAHAEHPRSHGIDGKFGLRNSPVLFNLNWNTSFMYDGGVNHITVQPLAPLQDAVEMDAKLEDILAYLNASSDYRTRFKKAYGNDQINSQMMLKAFAQFMGAMVSSKSKFDRVSRGEDSFSANELIGKQIFMSRCNSCHAAPLFTNHQFYNIGLQPNVALADSGRMRITQLEADRNSYRTPTLRNIEWSSPYMHDGRFSSLTMAIDFHMNKSVNASNVPSSISNGTKISAEEIANLIAFLRTLSDQEFIKDKHFSEEMAK